MKSLLPLFTSSVVAIVCPLPQTKTPLVVFCQGGSGTLQAMPLNQADKCRTPKLFPTTPGFYPKSALCLGVISTRYVTVDLVRITEGFIMQLIRPKLQGSTLAGALSMSSRAVPQ